MTKKIFKSILILLVLIIVQSCSSNRSTNSDDDSSAGNPVTVKLEGDEANTDSKEGGISDIGDTDGQSDNTTNDQGFDGVGEDAFDRIYYTDNVVELNTADFKRLIYDMDNNPNKWVFEGALPAIVDFYAVWCGPCKMVAPYLEELAKDYAGKINIYKIDAERERWLASYLRVRGYPTFMIIPKNGEPRIFAGFPPGVSSQADIKPAFEKIIQNELLK